MKWLKWLVVILIVIQIGTYFWNKYKLPTQIVLLLEKNGCDSYEPYGMDLPLDYFISTESMSTLYLTSIDSPSKGLTKLKVTLIDTSPPLLKGITNFRFQISGEQIKTLFSDCWRSE